MDNKGFTLAEMVAVIAILMVLALLSTPFVKGYIDDAYNGKAQTFLRQFNEARMNFEKDYPGTTVTGTISSDDVPDCNIENIYGQTGLSVSPSFLLGCKYLHYPTELNGRYTFSVGGECSVCSESAVSMIGGDNSGIYQGKCACIDSLGRIYRESTD